MQQHGRQQYRGDCKRNREPQTAGQHPPVVSTDIGDDRHGAQCKVGAQRTIERSLPNLVVLSYREIAPNVQVHASGSVSL